jgi:hypothetical protein
MTEIKKTATSIFMVPTLKIGRERLYRNNFINAYIKDVGKDVQYEDAAYLLFKPKDFDIFKEFVDEEYQRTEAIIDDYDYDGGFVVLVYTLDPRYLKDFALVKLGKYSKTSQEFQALFPKVVKNIRNGRQLDEIALQFRIFNKTDDLKEYWENRTDVDFTNDMEVWEGFNETNETLDIEKLKELV